MSEHREELRPEDAADAASSAEAAALPEEERLNEASPDDAAGAANPGRAADERAADTDAAGGGDGEPTSDGPDFKDQYLRAMAELDNVRKRARRDVGAAEQRGIAKLAKEVLPALDDLERALQAAPEDDPMRTGVKIVHERLLAALARLGIAADAPKGEAFDPHRHEAVAQQPVEGAQSGTIVEVYANGYTLGDDVLRAAKVVVAA